MNSSLHRVASLLFHYSKARLYQQLLTILLVFVSLVSYGQKQKDVVFYMECVKYIGNDTYVASYGYDNPNSKDVIVTQTNSQVIYNYGQSKKYALNTFKRGRQYNVFTQEFTSKDRCIWRVVLPNGSIKETSASSSSVHCRDNTLGLDPIFNGNYEGGVIWPELYYLAQDFNTTGQAASNEVFQITSDFQVLIEIIAVDEAAVAALKPILQSLGLSNEVENGLNTLLITGYMPISNVLQLNNYENLINFVRAVYTPILNAGTVLTQGDSAQGSDVVRNGWGLNGAGLKIGILSDSYNNLGKASDDVATENLPSDVNILKDYPSNSIFSSQLDEGRAMAQIVHDIVPEADLLFHTGIISSGDFAAGILKMGFDYNCNLIVDDVTHITEPFFQDGVIAHAVNSVVNRKGVYYATSAGNFGSNSYESVSAPVTFNVSSYSFLPNDNTLRAHDFGGGDIKQSLSLMPGRYLIKFEWDEPFYTLKQMTGALTNFDIWVVSDDNQLLYSGNRDNRGEDPQEYMAFSVPGTSAFPVNFFITASNMPSGKKIKYTIFRSPAAGFAWNDQTPGIGAGTIFSQANSAGAVAVGAVLFSNTPPYGVNLPTIASFSSRGGVPVYGIDRHKPDFTAPNGVNTTVDLGNPFNDGDPFPNFFGTSASAPHNVGVAAQILEAGKVFYDATWTPAELKTKMIAGAIDMGAPGYDRESGYGFVQANNVLQNLANPKPQLYDVSANQEIIAGQEYTNLVIKADGDYFTEQSTILLRGEPIPTTFISNSELSSSIVLTGDPEISVYTPALAGTNGSDGGTSGVQKLFGVEKTVVTIKSDNKTKYYLEALPDYTYTATGLPEGVTLESLGLNIVYEAPATQISNVGEWQIIPHFGAVPEVGLTELYDFQFPDIEDQGKLTILQLGIKITPEDITGLYYGDSIPVIQSRIDVTTPGVVIDQNLLDDILVEYQSLFSPDVDYAVANASRSLANASRGLANASRGLANGTSWMISGTAVINQSRSLANASRSLANASRGLVNGNTVIDIDTELLGDYDETPGGTNLILNASRGLANASRGLVNSRIYATGDDDILTNASRSLANASRGLVNAELFNDENNDEVVLIFDKDNTDLDGGANLPITNIYPIHLVTGLDATSDEDYNHCWVLPGAYISNGEGDGYLSVNNFTIDYGQGMIEILPAPLTVIANDSTKVYGTADPVEFTFTISDDTPLVLDDVVESVFTGSLEREQGEDVLSEGSSYAITQGTLNAGPNYNLTVIPGEFTLTPAALSVSVVPGQGKIYGEEDPEIQYTSMGLVGDDTFTGALSLSREVGENVGVYPVTLGSLSAGSNYITTLEDGGTFAVTPATVEVTVVPGQGKIYGEEDMEIQYTSMGLVGDDTFTGVLSREEGENVGVYPVTLGGLSAGSNYITTLVDGGTIAITPATVEVTVVPGQGKIYGEEDPEIQYTSMGLVGDDTFTGALSPVTLGSLSAGSNYITTLVDGGAFAITAATLEVTAVSGQTKVYGEDDPPLEYTSIGLVGDDLITGALLREDGEDVGSYMILQGTLDAGSNYAISITERTFTITARDLSVSANNSSKIFGMADPPFTYTITSGSLASWDQIVGSLERESGETIDYPYEIHQGSLAIQNNTGVNTTNNYNFHFDYGVFTISYPLSDVKKIRPYLNCVETDGTYYYANFGYENTNAYDIYIEAFGPDNYFEGTGIINASAMPSVFRAGGGDFSIKFDGTRVAWVVSSLDSDHKTATTSEASAGSGRCGYTGARLAGVADDRLGAELDMAEISSYPNPVSSVFYINLSSSLVSTVDIQLVDIQGKAYDPRFVRNVTGSRLELDMSGLKSGLYILNLNLETGQKMLKVMKQ